MVSVRGSALACKESSFTLQAPLSSAVALLLCPAKATVTFSPGAAVPHTGTAMPRWSTMWGVNTLKSLTSACSAEASRRSEQKASDDFMREGNTNERGQSSLIYS